jgi:hypothetical protein
VVFKDAALRQGFPFDYQRAREEWELAATKAAEREPWLPKRLRPPVPSANFFVLTSKMITEWRRRRAHRTSALVVALEKAFTLGDVRYARRLLLASPLGAGGVDGDSSSSSESDSDGDDSTTLDYAEDQRRFVRLERWYRNNCSESLSSRLIFSALTSQPGVGRTATIDYLFDKLGIPSDHCVGPLGESPIHVAVLKRDMDLARDLLAHGCSPFALHDTTDINAVEDAVLQLDCSVLRRFLDLVSAAPSTAAQRLVAVAQNRSSRFYVYQYMCKTVPAESLVLFLTHAAGIKDIEVRLIEFRKALLAIPFPEDSVPIQIIDRNLQLLREVNEQK